MVNCHKIGENRVINWLLQYMVTDALTVTLILACEILVLTYLCLETEGVPFPPFIITAWTSTFFGYLNLDLAS